MDQIFKSITSLEWWFTVVIVAIVISLFSSYLKEYTDVFFNSLSETRKRKHQAELTRLKIVMEELKVNEGQREYFKLLIAKYTNETNQCIIMGCSALVIGFVMVNGSSSFILNIGAIVITSISFIMFLLAQSSKIKGAKLEMLLKEALNINDLEKKL